MIVVDTNLIVYLMLEGESTKTAEKVFEKDPDWVAPVLWQSEFRNVMSVYMKQKVVSLKTALAMTERAEMILSGKECRVPSQKVLKLTKSSGCSAYDCEFVVLARDLKLKMLTTDKALIKAFPGTAVHPANF